MTFDEWEATVPETIRRDVIWRVQAFRLASFLSVCVERDTRTIAGDPRFVPIAAQLCRAAGSVAANVAEGYPRQSARDRVRYYEYALGSAAEVRVWYLTSQASLDPEVLDGRIALLRSITRLLLTMIRSARNPASSRTRPP